MKTYLTLVVIVAVLIFLTGAFITKELNPINWERNGRIIASVIFFFCSFFALACLADSEPYENEPW